MLSAAQKTPEETLDDNSQLPALVADAKPARTSLFAAMRSWLRSVVRPRGDASIRSAIEEVLEEHEEAAELLPAQERAMLHNVLEFGEMTVQDIMIPRTDIIAVAEDVTLEQLKAHIIEQRHTRIPVYHNTLDHIRGFLHVKDIFPIVAQSKNFQLSAVMRPMLFVPPSMKIIDLLVKMRRSGSHMAIVVDEYGGTDGLVTLEDLFEEIVGDIQDEHDEEEHRRDIIKLSETVYEADAKLPIERLEQELGVSVLTEQEDETFDTLGGLIFFELGRIPVKGEKIQHSSGLTFEVIDVDTRRVKSVRIIRTQTA